MAQTNRQIPAQQTAPGNTARLRNINRVNNGIIRPMTPVGLARRPPQATPAVNPGTNPLQARPPGGGFGGFPGMGGAMAGVLGGMFHGGNPGGTPGIGGGMGGGRGILDAVLRAGPSVDPGRFGGGRPPIAVDPGRVGGGFGGGPFGHLPPGGIPPINGFPGRPGMPPPVTGPGMFGQGPGRPMLGQPNLPIGPIIRRGMGGMGGGGY